MTVRDRPRSSDRGPRSIPKALVACAAGAFLLCALSRVLDAHDRITTRVTWAREIAPIFAARCMDCHRSGGRSTIALETYQQARPWAVAIKEEVLARRMPIWNAARGYGEFANDPSLSPFEIALIAAWVDGGAPELEKNKPSPAVSSNVKVAAFTPPRATSLRTVSMPCGEHPATGTLLAIRPALEKDGTAGVAAILPSGRQQILAWIRNYDPEYPVTYWLRKPLALPAGSRVRVESTGNCAIDLTFAR